MNDPIDMDSIRDKALLASFGLQNSAEEADILHRAEHGETAALAELTAYREALAQVAQLVPEATPPAGLRARLMAKIAEPAPTPLGWQNHRTGFDYLRAGDGKWQDAPFPGVSFQILHYDRKSGLATQLVRMEAGASFPPHVHGAAEQCMVMEGTVATQSLKLQKGDFNIALPGTEHERLFTETGCMLLIISNPHDEVLAHH